MKNRFPNLLPSSILATSHQNHQSNFSIPSHTFNVGFLSLSTRFSSYSHFDESSSLFLFFRFIILPFKAIHLKVYRFIQLLIPGYIHFIRVLAFQRAFFTLLSCSVTIRYTLQE